MKRRFRPGVRSRRIVSRLSGQVARFSICWKTPAAVAAFIATLGQQECGNP